MPNQPTPKEKIRNIAIIAHVDHGKTTLIDSFIKQSHLFRDNQEEMQQDLILDFNELEREKGITIQAKNISIPYKGYKINIIDTPGHADFGGEVERTLNMADGVLLLVDAQEGVMPQTRFVLKKALEMGLKTIAIINKIDKKLADPKMAENRLQDLFLNLVTDESQLEYKTFYAVGRDGKIWKELPKETGDDLANVPGDISPILEAVIEEFHAPIGDETAPFQMQVSALDYDQHNGRYLIGRILNGKVSVGDNVVAVSPTDPSKVSKGKVKFVYIKDGLEYAEVKTASVGEIVAILGLDAPGIGETLCSPDKVEAIEDIKISPPSLKIKFEANTSPFLGREGKYPNLKQLQQRLDQEAITNVSLKIEKNSDGSYYVMGRGELHLAILIETLRREGYEFQVRKPEVILKEVDGVKMEPVEEVYIETPEQYFSVVSREVNARKGEMINMVQENGQTKVTYKMLARNLVGLRRILLTGTKGNLAISNNFLEYVKYDPSLELPHSGRLVSNINATALAYALNMIQERGDLFITPGTEVYSGMIIGLNKYENDMEVNPAKAREKSNVRMSTAVITEIKLKSPIQLTLEYAIGFLTDDEILEVTPLNLRLRRKYLTKQAEFDATKRMLKK